MTPRLAATNWHRLLNIESPAAMEARHTARPLPPRLRKAVRALAPLLKTPSKPTVLRWHRVA